MSGMSSTGESSGQVHQMVERDGVSLHVVRSGPRRAPRVLLHGLSANAESFAGLLRAGLDARREVIRIDLRGRGLSDQPEGPVYSMQAHGEDVIAVMDAAGL